MCSALNPQNARPATAGGLTVHGSTSARGSCISASKKTSTARKAAHIAYELDDLEPLLLRLREAGHICRTDDEPDVPIIPGWRRFQTRDPVGNQIEFVARRVEAS